MKKFRVDTFSYNHEKHYFETETEAVEYGKAQAEKGKIAFLLEQIADNKYDVVSVINKVNPLKSL